MSLVDDDVLREFLIDGREGLDRLDGELCRLEENPADREILGSIFRTFHTIKGTCGFFGFNCLEAISHAAETLLSRLRDGELAMSEEIASALLETVDAVREIFAAVELSGGEGVREDGALRARLARLAGAAGAPGAGLGAGGQDEDDGVNAGLTVEPTIRIGLEVADRLMNLVGELVLARNQVVRQSTGPNPAAQRLSAVTAALQEEVMRTRMQPIANAWRNLPRLVRDLCVSCGKQAHLEMSGGDTALDRNVIQEVRDPLTHLVRNCVDHGIETPEARRAAGKPEYGTIHLRAFHEGGQVVVEVADDGAGIDLARLRERAVESGVIAADSVGPLSRRELVQLIFQPGISSATAVTSISGRGVGMDVVKNNIERLSGSVEVESDDRGTRIRLKIPLTLAIVPALIVVASGQHYAIPQTSLREIVRAGEDRLESICGVSVFRLRDRLIPVVSLPGLLETERAGGGGAGCLVVLSADGRHFGLLVDGVSDSEEIVVKPLDRWTKEIPVFAGATILGDGRVALILDVVGLAEKARVIAGARATAVLTTSDEDADAAVAAAHETYLIVTDRPGAGERFAVPLAAVARLEEFTGSDVERADGQPVVQYRGRILPLVSLARELRSEPGERLLVVVHGAGSASFGLVVGAVLDVVDGPAAREASASTPGAAGSAVLGGRVVGLVDVTVLAERAGAR